MRSSGHLVIWESPYPIYFYAINHSNTPQVSNKGECFNCYRRLGNLIILNDITTVPLGFMGNP